MTWRTWFGAGDQAPSEQGPRDPLLPALSVEQAAALTEVTRRVLAERGVDAVVDEGVVQLPGGRSRGLVNLSVTVANAPFEEWPALVARHMAQMDELERRGPEPFEPHQVLPRLVTAETATPPPDYPAPEVLPGVLALVAVDHPTSVATRMDGLDDLGGYQAAWELAMTNLANLPDLPADPLLADLADPGSTVWVLAGDDFFGATRVLVLEQLLAANDITVGAAGLLVAVPHRDLILLHVLTGPGVVQGLNLMLRLAARQHAGGQGPLVPDVFHLGPDLLAGGATQVTRHEEGRVVVQVSGSFATAMAGLELLG